MTSLRPLKADTAGVIRRFLYFAFPTAQAYASYLAGSGLPRKPPLIGIPLAAIRNAAGIVAHLFYFYFGILNTGGSESIIRLDFDAKK